MHNIRHHEPCATTPPGGNGNLAVHTLHSPEQASERLGSEIVLPSWLREKARTGAIPHVKIAGKIAFTDAHLTEIVRQFEVSVGPEVTASTPRRRPAASADDVPLLRARRPKRRSA